MIRLALPFAAISLAALAGCSQRPASPAPADETPTQSPAPTATVTATATARASGTPTPAPRASGPGIPEFGIPEALQGRWGLVPADCTSTRGDAKGLLIVSSTTLTFYESRGILTRIDERSDSRIRAAFAFSGEGMTWRRDEVLDAQNGGKTLVRREYGEDAAPGPFRYTRCAR
jgi:hypothetical protein